MRLLAHAKLETALEISLPPLPRHCCSGLCSQALGPWAPGPLDPWSPRPLDPWSPGPLVPWVSSIGWAAHPMHTCARSTEMCIGLLGALNLSVPLR